MNPMLQVLADLADKFGVKLSDRIAIDVECGFPDFFAAKDAYYDGSSIATRIQRWAYLPKDMCPKSWGDVGKGRSVLTLVDEATDHHILHEIAHFVAASESQRDLPEYGLGTVVYGTPLGGQDRWSYKSIPAVVDSKESAIQECMAQLLCVFWGKRYGISDYLPELMNTQGWDEYLSYKIGEWSQVRDSEPMWIAIARVRALTDLGTFVATCR